MEKQKLVLGFKDKETEYTFDDKVFLVEDKSLLENISKPNIKNQNSEMVIKSLNDTSVSDVIQIKINVSETGYFLVSFDKEKLGEEQRSELLKEIGSLKSDEAPTNESQIKKIQELLGFLGKYGPIYSTFANNGNIKIDQAELEKIDLSFPLLVLAQPKKKFSIKIGKPKDQKKEQKDEQENVPTKEREVKEKERVTYEPFELFDIDYLFIFIFSLLGSFAITAAVFELMNKKGIAAFLIVLGFIFMVTLAIAIYSSVYKKNKLRNPWLRYYLGIFVILGIAIGIVSSFFICKGVLKTEIENFAYKKMLAFAIPISAVSMLCTLEASRLINLFMKIRNNKKSL